MKFHSYASSGQWNPQERCCVCIKGKSLTAQGRASQQEFCRCQNSSLNRISQVKNNLCSTFQWRVLASCWKRKREQLRTLKPWRYSGFRKSARKKNVQTLYTKYKTSQIFFFLDSVGENIITDFHTLHQLLWCNSRMVGIEAFSPR